MFPLTMFPLKDFPPNIISPNNVPLTTFLGPLVVLTWSNLTRVTDQAFGYCLTPKVSCPDKGQSGGDNV
jgi:hypothetical protein